MAVVIPLVPIAVESAAEGTIGRPYHLDAHNAPQTCGHPMRLSTAITAACFVRLIVLAVDVAVES
jgi:hypothetical protein